MARGFRAFAGLLLVVAAVGGCVPRPTPEALLPVAHVPATTSKVRLIVATTRAPLNQDTQAADSNVFTAKRSEDLNHAALTVSIPRRHKVGNIEWAQSLPPDPNTNFAVVERALGGLQDQLNSMTAARNQALQEKTTQLADAQKQLTELRQKQSDLDAQKESKLGQLQKDLASRESQIKEIVLAGRIERPSLFNLGFDALGARWLARIGKLADSFGYGAAVVVRADNGVRPGDVKIVWGDGSITIDREDALNRLEASLRRKLTDSDEHQADLFANEGHA